MALRKSWVRYILPLTTTVFAFALHQALVAWIGPGLPPFILFYPMVMLVALVAGLGPGLLAVGLTLVTVQVGIMSPVGHFVVASAVDRISLILFASNGLFIVFVAELYRRQREKAAALEREAALRDSREALRRQAELIDPVRAEVIAREMERFVRDSVHRVARPPVAAPAAAASEGLLLVPGIAGGVAIVVGLLVLTGWVLGIDAMRSLVPGLTRMKANTAVCFIFMGFALLCLNPRRATTLSTSQHTRLWFGRMAVAVVAVIAVLSLSEYVFDLDFGIDQLLFHDPGDSHTLPGRMAQTTAFQFLTAAGAFLLVEASTRASRWLQQILSLACALIGLSVLLGYAYRAKNLYEVAGSSSVALPTAIAFVVLGAGLLCARKDGIIAVMLSGGPGGQLAARMMPAVLAAPVIFGWLHVLGERTGAYSSPMGAGLFALSMVVSLAMLVWWTAMALNNADAVRAEKEAQLSNQAELMNLAEEALIVREMGGIIRSWNRGAESLYGWTASQAVGQRLHVLLGTPIDTVAAIEKALRETGHWEGEMAHTTRDGRRIDVEAHKTAIQTGSGVTLVLESLRDVTERKRAEAALRDSEARFRLALRNAPVSVAAQDLDLRYIWAYNQRPGGPGDIVGRLDSDILTPEEAARVTAAKRRVLEEGIEMREQMWFDRPGGRIFLDVCWEPIRDAQGKVVGVASATVDLTSIKTAEEALQALLREKEVLLREVHHRVKNNMQVISSLVNLQSNGMKEPAIRDLLSGLRDQVRAMALVHERLYQSESLARIDFGQYVDALSHYLEKMHGQAVRGVRLSVDAEPVLLAVETAVPCGLILNELVTNAFKHAFHGRESGEVRVRLRRDSNGSVCLVVSDNGVGLPAGLDWQEAPSLGLKLARLLAGQIHGRLELCACNGTAFQLTFTPPPAKQTTAL